MAGVLVPLVMIPRYTTYVGDDDLVALSQFTTIGMDVSEFERAILTVWRGHMLGSNTPLFKVTCEESTDQNTWSTCDQTTADEEVDPGEELQFAPVFNKRWFRIKIKLQGDDTVVSCWAVGFLEERVR